MSDEKSDAGEKAAKEAPKPEEKARAGAAEPVEGAHEESTERGDAAEREPSEEGSEDAADEAGDQAAETASSEADKPVVPAPKAASLGSGQPAFPRPSYVFLAVSSVLFFAADTLSKWWIVQYHSNPPARPEADGWHFRLSLVHNKGGAWGLLGDKPDYIRLPFFFLISAVAVVFVVSLYRKLEPRQHALRWALPLLLGGAAGNLIDRIRNQYVVDFLEFSITKAGQDSFRWPTFNVADVWIVFGVLLMAVDMFTPRKTVKRPPTPADDAEEPRRAASRSAKEKTAKAEA